MTDRDNPSNIQYSGEPISKEDADNLLNAIRSIMNEHKLNFGPAVDFYIKQRIKEGK